MYGVFSSLLGRLKKSSTVTDHFVFRMHYQLTVCILLAFCVVVTSTQFFGTPIDCMGTFNKDEVPLSVINTYCWVHTTFTVLDSDTVLRDRVDMPYPGIGTNNIADLHMNDDVDSRTVKSVKIYHDYYQWVGFVFLIQAIFFYLPKFVWSVLEGGKITRTVEEIYRPALGMFAPPPSKIQSMEEDGSTLPDLDPFGPHNKKMPLLAKHIFKFRKHDPKLWQWLFLADILNFTNVVVQIVVTNKFLHGRFGSYGSDVLRYYRERGESEVQQINPMIVVFPLMTKCTFYRFGISGSVQSSSVLCLLPINIFNQRIFLFLWFWYIVLSIISGMWLLGWIAVLSSKRFRHCLLVGFPCTYGSHNKDCSQDRTGDLQPITANKKNDNSERLKVFVYDDKRTNLSDWLRLRFLKRNLDPLNFDIVTSILDNLVKKEQDTEKDQYEQLTITPDKTLTGDIEDKKSFELEKLINHETFTTDRVVDNNAS